MAVIFSATPTADDPAWGNASLRLRVLVSGGNIGQVRIKVRTRPTGGMVINDAGLGAWTGSVVLNEDSFTTAQPQRITWVGAGGGNGITIPANTDVVSDWLTPSNFTWVNGDSLVAILDLASGDSIDTTGLGTNFVGCFIIGSGTFNVANPAGMSNQSGTIYSLFEIETQSSAAGPAAFSVISGGGVMRVVPTPY